MLLQEGRERVVDRSHHQHSSRDDDRLEMIFSRAAHARSAQRFDHATVTWTRLDRRALEASPGGSQGHSPGLPVPTLRALVLCAHSYLCTQLKQVVLAYFRYINGLNRVNQQKPTTRTHFTRIYRLRP